MPQHELLSVVGERSAAQEALVAGIAITNIVEAPRLSYYNPVEGGALAMRATVSGPQKPTNPNPTTNTSGTHSK